jgi:hypothetical protein
VVVASAAILVAAEAVSVVILADLVVPEDLVAAPVAHLAQGSPPVRGQVVSDVQVGLGVQALRGMAILETASPFAVAAAFLAAALVGVVYMRLLAPIAPTPTRIRTTITTTALTDMDPVWAGAGEEKQHRVQCGRGALTYEKRPRSCGALKSMSGPIGTMPVGFTCLWLP